MRRAARTDQNHKSIVDALRAVGATVQDLSAVGKGCPDILVGYRGHNVLLEIKDGTLAPSRRHLTDDQIAWHAHWRGRVRIATSVAEALHLVGATQ